MTKNTLIHVSLLSLLAASLALGGAGCSKAPATEVASAAPKLPEDWYRLPEDGPRAPGAAGLEETSALAEPSATVGEALDETLDAQHDVLEGLSPEAPVSQAMSLAPSDLTPWRLAAFMTDLSVSASGVLGSLTAKGTPAVSLIWRKKEGAAHIDSDAAADVALTSEASANEIQGQLDGAVRAAMATGRIRDEARLRGELGSAIANFHELVSGLDTNPGAEWWPSRIRLDVLVDASGKVAFFSSLGSEVRLRFEWHRIKHPAAAHGPALASVDPRAAEGRRSFNELVAAVADDLSVLSAPGADLHHGYQPYLFRVGVGVTAGGTFGIAKGNATAIGQVYFSKDTPKPSMKGLDIRSATLGLIESQPGSRHLGFAQVNGISAADGGGAFGQVVYQVNRAQLRKGLARAERMAGFFARHARKTRAGKWGLYELRASFDMSLSGKFGVATAGGLATAEIDLYNEEF